jgi:ankyrin repeat protein
LGNVETLLSKGADINQCDAEGNTAMHFAVMTKSIEMVMLLDSKGGQADIANGEGETPIMMSMGDQHIALFFKS